MKSMLTSLTIATLLLSATSLMPFANAAPAPNDDVQSAVRIVAAPFTFAQDTSDATLQNGESIACGGSDRSVWFVFEALVNGTLDIDTAGSDHDTTLAFYHLFGSITTTPTFASLKFISCNDNNFGPQSRMVVSVEAGSRYYIRAAGFDGAGGLLRLNVDVITLPDLPVGVTRSDSVLYRPAADQFDVNSQRASASRTRETEGWGANGSSHGMTTVSIARRTVWIEDHFDGREEQGWGYVLIGGVPALVYVGYSACASGGTEVFATGGETPCLPLRNLP